MIESSPRRAQRRSKTVASSRLLATPEQGALLQQIGGMMSLLEGHGDVTMDRAGAGLIPNADRFSRVLAATAPAGQRDGEARSSACSASRPSSTSTSRARSSSHAVEAEGGTELLNRAFVAPEFLPSLAEIRDPRTWIDRVAVDRRRELRCSRVATILVVDDEPDIRLLTQLNLERDGHDIVTGGRRRRGAALCNRALPDLILLDVMMPEVDGWAVLDELKAHLGKPISDDPRDRCSPRSAVRSTGCKGGIEGAVRYLTKPFDARRPARRGRPTRSTASPNRCNAARPQGKALEMLARIERNVSPTAPDDAPRPRLSGLERGPEPPRPSRPAPVQLAAAEHLDRPHGEAARAARRGVACADGDGSRRVAAA